MSLKSPVILRVLVGVLLIFVSEKGLSQQESGPFSEVPDKFSQRQDSLGFFWQVEKHGAVTSGETQYLPSGAKLSVGGTPFVPGSGELQDRSEESGGGVDLALREVRDGLTITRSIWYDLERGGVRLVDTFSNTGKTTANLEVELKSTYSFAWQNLHGVEGNILTQDPGPKLGERDFGLLVRFNQAEGRHDTAFVTCGETDTMKPILTASSNQRELRFLYSLDIAAGTSKTLVHWILQRSLSAPGEVAEIFAPFYQRRRLANSRVEKDLIPTVANFDEQSFPREEDRPGQVESLIRLNDLIDQMGLHRGEEDTLWISTQNQIAGTVHPEAKVLIESNLVGEREYSIQQVAAIRGGGGVGRKPLVFLRDGQVLSGNLRCENLSIKAGNEWTVDGLQAAELNLLLCRLSPEDGKVAKGSEAYVEMRDGSILAVARAEGEESQTIEAVTPWGIREVALSELAEVGYVSTPSPRIRLRFPDESRLSVFLKNKEMALQWLTGSAGGSPLSLAADQIVGMWAPGATGLGIQSIEDFWLDFSELDRDVEFEEGFLLHGNNLIRALPIDEEWALIDQASVVQVATAEIASFRRLLDQGSASHPVFELEMKNGEILTGRLRTTDVGIRWGEIEWQIPVPHLLAGRFGGEDGE